MGIIGISGTAFIWYLLNKPLLLAVDALFSFFFFGLGGFSYTGSLGLVHQTVHALILTPSKLGFTLVAHRQEPCGTAITLLLIM